MGSAGHFVCVSCLHINCPNIYLEDTWDIARQNPQNSIKCCGLIFILFKLVHDTVRFIWNNIDCTLKALHATNISRDSLLSCIEGCSKFCDYYARILFSIYFDVSSYSTSDNFIQSGHLPSFCKYRLRVF